MTSVSTRKTAAILDRARAIGNRVRLAVGAGALVALAAACNHGGGSAPYVWVDDLEDRQVAPAPGTYIIGPGDLVSIQVFNHPEMAVRTRVREDGAVSVPLLGDMPASGESPADLGRAIEAQLAARSLAVAPRATVVLEERAPLRVPVLGEVARPGLFQLDPGAGVAEALASAGGFTEFAHRDRLYVVRRQPAAVRIRLRYNDLARANGRAADLRLRPGDVVVVE